MPRALHRFAPIASIAALIAAAGALVAGPLTPPAGTVASTYKTLAEVEPRTAVNATNTPGDGFNVYRITQPGSYYLTGNIVNATKTGVSIESSGVTLDLNGFEILDTSPSTGSTRYGVQVALGVRNVCVRNGTIRNANDDGVHDQGLGCRFEDLSFYGCRDCGLYSEKSATISRCTAQFCSQDGFAAWGATITGCTSTSNSNRGYILGSDSSASHCIATANLSSGFELLGGVATNCTSSTNAYGYHLYGATVDHCGASYNNSGQIRMEAGCVARQCSLDGPVAFPIVLLISSNNLVQNNQMTQGSYAVQDTSGGSNVIIGNMIFTPATGAIASQPSDCVGPIVNAGGTIASTSPYANFLR